MSEAKIIVAANQKGGVGKTALTIGLATALSQKPFFKKILVIDTDEQTGITNNRNRETNLFKSKGKDIPKNAWSLITTELNSLPDIILNDDNLKTYDYIFIDMPGILVHEGIGTLLKLTDFMLIPFKPNIDDIDSTLSFMKVALKAKEWRKEKGLPLEIHGLITMPSGKTEVLEAKKFMENNVKLNMFDAIFPAYKYFTTRSTFISMYHAKNTPEFHFRRVMNEFIDKAKIK